ncbi:uncharacterized protein CLUP02_00220 [Colletotrichum lupini]|uniref:Uncharacterized protein n=1 Tax=Colletotrichum lupini TaxID=145971 RepID=A0A9Q8SAD1_9PEZI|nr:uncharacterized protein CLUP02_00220 [Colletotrichum lupini]UQC73575.1 hypothetical protein CLUP02_00220 [Colletotrichum lupini]
MEMQDPEIQQLGEPAPPERSVSLPQRLLGLPVIYSIEIWSHIGIGRRIGGLRRGRTLTILRKVGGVAGTTVSVYIAVVHDEPIAPLLYNWSAWSSPRLSGPELVLDRVLPVLPLVAISGAFLASLFLSIHESIMIPSVLDVERGDRAAWDAIASCLV